MRAYLSLAPYAVIAVLIGLVLWYRADLISAEAARDRASTEAAQLRQTNQDNLATIEKITTMNNVAAQITADTNNLVANINKNMADTKSSVNRLETSNAAIKAYLDNNIPDDIQRLLNNPGPYSPH